MTLAQLVTQLQQMLYDHPQLADCTVVIAPHGRDFIQPLAEVHAFVGNPKVLLEARR